MEFTETQREILFNAWLFARDGNGQVIEDWAYPDAHELAEMGWLERRFEPDGEMSWGGRRRLRRRSV
jgi:hypothetical protein